ncbi:MAG: hypothetical protein ABIQ31_24600 [Ferruginibacter sp.]
MIEVFKTNVRRRGHAKMLLEQIHRSFAHYKANFDLADCDKILRVKSSAGAIQSSCLVDLLKSFGFHAEVLPDVPQPFRLAL